MKIQLAILTLFILSLKRFNVPKSVSVGRLFQWPTTLSYILRHFVAIRTLYCVTVAKLSFIPPVLLRSLPIDLIPTRISATLCFGILLAVAASVTTVVPYSSTNKQSTSLALNEAHQWTERRPYTLNVGAKSPQHQHARCRRKFPPITNSWLFFREPRTAETIGESSVCAPVSDVHSALSRTSRLWYTVTLSTVTPL